MQLRKRQNIINRAKRCLLVRRLCYWSFWSLEQLYGFQCGLFIWQWIKHLSNEEYHILARKLETYQFLCRLRILFVFHFQPTWFCGLEFMFETKTLIDFLRVGTGSVPRYRVVWWKKVIFLKQSNVSRRSVGDPSCRNGSRTTLSCCGSKFELFAFAKSGNRINFPIRKRPHSCDTTPLLNWVKCSSKWLSVCVLKLRRENFEGAMETSS